MVPQTIQRGATATQIRSPASGSAWARHQASAWDTLPESMSYRREQSTRSSHGTVSGAIPMARCRSAVRST